MLSEMLTMAFISHRSQISFPSRFVETFCATLLQEKAIEAEAAATKADTKVTTVAVGGRGGRGKRGQRQRQEAEINVLGRFMQSFAHGNLRNNKRITEL